MCKDFFVRVLSGQINIFSSSKANFLGKDPTLQSQLFHYRAVALSGYYARDSG